MPCSDRGGCAMRRSRSCSIGARARHRVDARPGCRRALDPRRDPAARDIPVLRTRRLRRAADRGPGRRSAAGSSTARPSGGRRAPNARACATLARRIDDLRGELAASVGSPDAERIDRRAGSRRSHAWRDLDCRPGGAGALQRLRASAGRVRRVRGRGAGSRTSASRLAFELYSYDVQGRRRRVDAADSTAPSDCRRRVTAEGRYRLEIFKRRRTVRSRPASSFDVVAPPPALTKSCA